MSKIMEVNDIYRLSRATSIRFRALNTYYKLINFENNNKVLCTFILGDLIEILKDGINGEYYREHISSIDRLKHEIKHIMQHDKQKYWKTNDEPYVGMVDEIYGYLISL
jgi:hypothetical protein